MAELRFPGAVPEEPALTLDTDGDGLADTGVTDDGVDLVIATDLDGDGLADQLARIGPDGVPRLVEHPFLVDVLLDLPPPDQVP